MAVFNLNPLRRILGMKSTAVADVGSKPVEALSDSSFFVKIVRKFLGREAARIGDSSAGDDSRVVASVPLVNVKPAAVSSTSPDAQVMQTQQKETQEKELEVQKNSQPQTDAQKWHDEKFYKERPAIWFRLLQLQDWQGLNNIVDTYRDDLPDFVGDDDIYAVRQTDPNFYPVFATADIQALQGKAGEPANGSAKFSEVVDRDRNSSLHIAILGASQNYDAQKVNAFVKNLLEGARNVRESGSKQHDPFLVQNKDGDNPMHLAAKHLEDFSAVAKFFRQEQKAKVAQDQQSWMFQKNKAGENVFDIVTGRQDCGFKENVMRMFPKQCFEANQKRSSLQSLREESDVDDHETPRSAVFPAATNQVESGRQVVVGGHSVTFVSAVQANGGAGVDGNIQRR